MTRSVPFSDFLRDPQLVGGAFAGDTWRAWREGFAPALDGLPVPDDLVTLVRDCTGRAILPTDPAAEVFVAAGRRSGKSRIAAALAVHAATCRDYRGVLAPGERGVAMVLASDRRQARVVLGYSRGLIEASPLLASQLDEPQTERLRLRGPVDVEVHTASFRAVRGYTVVLAVADECAFWATDDDATNADAAVFSAIRPALATVPGARLVAVSSPYAKRGELFAAFERHHGRDGDPVLTWRAATRTMNPSVPERVVAEALEADPSSARAEWLAEWRDDVESFVGRDAVRACVVPGRRERPRVPGVAYVAFCDPSGGAVDSMTLAVAHAEGARVVLDCVRERRPPFSPSDVVEDFAATLKAYGVATVHGDRYAGEWPREQFRARGVEYRPSRRSKSDLYRESLPLLNAGRAELLDDGRLVAQVCGLERRVARGGRDSIDHAPGGRDDVANAALAALVVAAERQARGVGGMVRLAGFSRHIAGRPGPTGLPSITAPSAENPTCDPVAEAWLRIGRA